MSLTINRYSSWLIVATVIVGSAGCGVERNSAEYDERRYKELQKANCEEMAYLLAKPLLVEEPQDYDKVVKRCHDLKSLSFEEYGRLSDHARSTGSWDIYELFPNKQTPSAIVETEIDSHSPTIKE